MFVLIVKQVKIRYVVVLVPRKKLRIKHLDVKKTLLSSILEEEVFIKVSNGWKNTNAEEKYAW